MTNTDLGRLEAEVRDLIIHLQVEPENHPFRATENREKIIACLDVIGDTELAILSYEKLLKSNPSTGELYLTVYGILQVLFVQQDAVSDLGIAAVSLNSLKNNVELRPIRNARNFSIGHPTQRNVDRTNIFSFISRATLSINGFTLMTSSGSEAKFQAIEIPNLITVQREVLCAHMQTIKHTLIQKQEQFMNRFQNTPIASCLEQGLGHALQQVSHTLNGGGSKSLALAGIDSFRECTKQLQKGLIQRNESGWLKHYEESFKLVGCAHDQLTQHLNSFTKAENNQAKINLRFLFSILQEYKKTAREVDLRYSKDE